MYIIRLEFYSFNQIVQQIICTNPIEAPGRAAGFGMKNPIKKVNHTMKFITPIKLCKSLKLFKACSLVQASILTKKLTQSLHQIIHLNQARTEGINYESYSGTYL